MNNLSELFMKYKSNYSDALYDLVRHGFLLTGTVYAIYQLQNHIISIFPTILLGLLNVKTFIIFHDCGHRSYTPSSTLNTVIGFFTGILVATPLSWSVRHDTHHVTNGNIENKYNWRFNEHIYYTVKEYNAMPLWKRIIIYFLLSPQFFYAWLPFVNFLVLERFSVFKLFYRKTRQIANIGHIVEQVAHNTLFFYFLYTLSQFNILYHWFVSLWIGSNIGVILFHNQHTFDPAYITTDNTWTILDSGLKGSSYIDIPYLLSYFTGGIEYHHIHHMNSKIPNYHLQAYHDTYFKDCSKNITILSMKDCYYNLWLTLYDEDKKQYVPFN